jgi:hypothetical protein
VLDWFGSAFPIRRDTDREALRQALAAASVAA